VTSAAAKAVVVATAIDSTGTAGHDAVAIGSSRGNLAITTIPKVFSPQGSRSGHALGGRAAPTA
jgi:hypothetical protein